MLYTRQSFLGSVSSREVTRLCVIHHAQARQAGVLLTVTPSMSDSQLAALALFVDVSKIAQVVRNLVSNGLKFTPRGGSVDVEVEVMDKEGDTAVCRSLTMTVTDSGAGISKV